VAADYRQAEAHIRPEAAHRQVGAASSCLQAAAHSCQTAASNCLGAASKDWVEEDRGWEAQPGLQRVAAPQWPRDFPGRHLIGARAGEIRRLRRTQHPADMSRHSVGISHRSSQVTFKRTRIKTRSPTDRTPHRGATGATNGMRGREPFAITLSGFVAERAKNLFNLLCNLGSSPIRNDDCDALAGYLGEDVLPGTGALGPPGIFASPQGFQ
jgi:hypothetical protein